MSIWVYKDILSFSPITPVDTLEKANILIMTNVMFKSFIKIIGGL